MPRNPEPLYLVLGQILRPHGIRGEIRMKIMTDYPDRLLSEIKTVYIGSDPEVEAQQYELKSARFHQNSMLLELKGLTQRNDVELLREQLVMIRVEDAAPLEDDEYYLYQLIGLTVKTADGAEIGQIVDIMETGANDVYVVESLTHGQILIPAHDETIIDIDLESEEVIMNPPDGILPD